MELKSSKFNIMRQVVIGFNRTFMELKFTIISVRPVKQIVLIVPLWN